MTQGRNWCITIFSPPINYFDEEQDQWTTDPNMCLAHHDSDRFYDPTRDDQFAYLDYLIDMGNNIVHNARVNELRYLVFQCEISPDTKHLHIQAYAEFNTIIRLGRLKTIFANDTIHGEIRRASKEAASSYCKKEDSRVPGETFFEFGAMVADGERTDLTAFYKDVKEGKSDLQLLETHTSNSIRYPRAAGLIRAAVCEHKSAERKQLHVYIFWGGPGTGKTHGAIQYCKNRGVDFHIVSKNAVSSGGTTMWMDGYRGQETLIIDDLNSDWIPEESLLSLLQHHKCAIQYKGGVTWAAYSTVYITSNIDPDDWFISKLAGGKIGYVNKNALFRRITGDGNGKNAIVCFDGNPDAPIPNFEPQRINLKEVLEIIDLTQ